MTARFPCCYFFIINQRSDTLYFPQLLASPWYPFLPSLIFFLPVTEGERPLSPRHIGDRVAWIDSPSIDSVFSPMRF